MKIEIKNLDRQTNEDILLEYFKFNNEYAIDMQEILANLLPYVIARSTLHNTLFDLMRKEKIDRKKIGNKYFYYKVNK